MHKLIATFNMLAPKVLHGILLYALLLAWPASHAQSGKRMALVIGNAAYVGEKALRNPVNDAVDMAAVLQRAGISVQRHTNVGRTEMNRAIESFMQAAEGAELAVVYYSGHGMQAGGEAFLVPTDAKINSERDVRSEGIRLGELMDDLEGKRIRNTLLIIDACRDNPYRSRTKSTTRGLARPKEMSGAFLVAYATADGATADDGEGRNGAYTAELLKQLNQSNRRNLRDLMEDTQLAVEQATRGAQRPKTYGDTAKFRNVYLLAGVVPEPTLQPPRFSSAAEVEQQAWDAARGANGEAAYRAYLSEYPQGRFVGAARVAIAAVRPAPVQEPVLPQAVSVVKIAHVGPLSGPIAHLGKDNENGAKLAVEELNTRGVQIGGNKVKLELVLEDDAADPRQAVAVAKKLVDLRVAAVVGHLNSGTSIPASKIYSEAGIPQISPSATNPLFTRNGYRTTFRLVANDAILADMLARFVATNIKPRAIAVIDDRTPYGQGIADEFEKAIRASGANLVSREFTTHNATDFTTILNSIKTNEPDLIFFGGMDTTAGAFLKQMRARGIRAKLVGGDGICSFELSKIAGAALEDNQVLCAEAGGVNASEVAALERFKKAYKQRFQTDVQVYAPYTYDAVMLVVSAMVSAGSSDPVRYLPSLSASNYAGVTGNISFDQRGDLKAGALTLYSYKRGQRYAVNVIR